MHIFCSWGLVQSFLERYFDRWHLESLLGDIDKQFNMLGNCMERLDTSPKNAHFRTSYISVYK